MWLGHVAACLCPNRLAKCGCVMGIGTQLQFCQFGDSGFVRSVEEAFHMFVVPCMSVHRDLLAPHLHMRPCCPS